MNKGLFLIYLEAKRVIAPVKFLFTPLEILIGVLQACLPVGRGNGSEEWNQKKSLKTLFQLLTLLKIPGIVNGLEKYKQV